METAGDLVKNRFEVYYIYENYSADMAAKAMKEWKVRCVGVLDNQERLCGVLSQSDISDKVVAEDRVPKVTSVSEIMTSRDLMVVLERASVEECMRLMRTNNIYHLLVAKDSLSELFIDGNNTRNRVCYNNPDDDSDRPITRSHFLGLISEKDLRKVELRKARKELEVKQEEIGHLHRYING